MSLSEYSKKVRKYNIKVSINILNRVTLIVQAFAEVRPVIIIRILGNSDEDVKKMIFKVMMITRKQIAGASFSGIRKA